MDQDELLLKSREGFSNVGRLVQLTGATQSSGVRVAPTVGAPCPESQHHLRTAPETARVNVWRVAGQAKWHVEMSLRPETSPNCSVFTRNLEELAERICLSLICAIS